MSLYFINSECVFNISFANSKVSPEEIKRFRIHILLHQVCYKTDIGDRMAVPSMSLYNPLSIQLTHTDQ